LKTAFIKLYAEVLKNLNEKKIPMDAVELMASSYENDDKNGAGFKELQDEYVA